MIGDFEPLGHNTEHLNIDPPLQKNPSGQFEGKENGSHTMPSGHLSQFPNELINVPGGQDVENKNSIFIYNF
jgi:hypothetical protein